MANMNFGVNLLPKENNTYTLGNSDKKWNLFVNQINGTTFNGIPNGVVVLTYGVSTYQDFADAFASGAMIYCRATRDTSDETLTDYSRYAALSYVNSNSNNLFVEFLYYKTHNHTANEHSDIAYIYTLTSDNTWTTSSRYVGIKKIETSGDGLSAGWNNNTVTLTTNSFTGSTTSTTGVGGLVPTPTTSDTNKFLCGNGNWATPSDATWSGKTLNSSGVASYAGNYYILGRGNLNSSEVTNFYVSAMPDVSCIASYNGSGYLSSTTPPSDDSSTKVATTSFVATAIANASLSGGGNGTVDLSTKVDKTALKNAGITSESYYTILNTFTVTTVQGANDIKPYARSSTMTGRISKHYTYRVTVNGTVYDDMPAGLWFEDNKTYEYIGNLRYYLSSIAGIEPVPPTVPFLIISDLDENNSIDVWTDTAGEYSIKVERIDQVFSTLPVSLIWGDAYAPIQKYNNNGTYNGFSIGINSLLDTRATFAIGYSNIIENEFGFALGHRNNLRGVSNYIIGESNQSKSHYTYIFGDSNYCHTDAYASIITGINCASFADYGYVEGCHNATYGTNSHAEGYNNYAMGSFSHVQGINSVSDSSAYASWEANKSYAVGDKVTTPAGYGAVCTTANNDATFDWDNWDYDQFNSNQAFIVGNGTANDNRSNALALDWTGDLHLKGTLYINCNANSSGGTSLSALLSSKVSDVKINNVSIVSSGTANIPIAQYHQLGVVVPAGMGISVNSNNGEMYIDCANTATIKAGTEDFGPIVVSHQHEATFYGLAKAAGDSTQAASSNAVGIYTNDAKSAIGSMLGIPGVMTACSSTTAGATGIVPAPAAGDEDKFLSGDGTWKSGGLPMVILSYGNSTWQDFINAYNNHVIVYCRASSNSNPKTGSQTRMAFMAYVSDATNPTNVEFQYYRSMNSHSATAMGDEVYVYKLTNAGAWSVTVRPASVKEIKMATGSAGSVSWNSNVVTLDSGLPAVTASDNGKILKVVNGVWTAVDP